jgi:hypothetical protein
MPGQDTVERTSEFLVFAYKGADGALTLRFIEKGMDKPLDEIYAHLSSGRAQSTYYYEIANGVCTTGRMSPAMLQACFLLGDITGYGVNAYLREKGTLNAVNRYIREYGHLARRPGCLARLFGKRKAKL